MFHCVLKKIHWFVSRFREIWKFSFKIVPREQSAVGLIVFTSMYAFSLLHLCNKFYLLYLVPLLTAHMLPCDLRRFLSWNQVSIIDIWKQEQSFKDFLESNEILPVQIPIGVSTGRICDSTKIRLSAIKYGCHAIQQHLFNVQFFYWVLRLFLRSITQTYGT